MFEFFRVGNNYRDDFLLDFKSFPLGSFEKNLCIMFTNKDWGERSMAETEERQKKPKKAEKTDIIEYLKQLPPPPKEHTHELKMEKRLKRMLKEQEKKK